MKSKICAAYLLIICLLPVGLVLITPPVMATSHEDNKEFMEALTNFKPLVGIPGVGTPNASNTVDYSGIGFGDYINALYRLAISIAALLAVIKIIYAGVQYMFSDIVTQKEDAKKDIQGALLGLLIIIGAVIILNTVNTDITKNEILMDPANTDGRDAGILDSVRANQIGVGLFASALEKCNRRHNTECTLDSWFASKEWCDERGGEFVDGNLLSKTIGPVPLLNSEGNFRNYCYYDERITPGHGLILNSDERVYNCGRVNARSGFSCLNAEARCIAENRTVISSSVEVGTVVCKGLTPDEVITAEAAADQQRSIDALNCFDEGRRWTGTACVALSNSEKPFPEPGLNFEMFRESDPIDVNDMNAICNRDGSTGWSFNFTTRLCIKQ